MSPIGKAVGAVEDIIVVVVLGGRPHRSHGLEACSSSDGSVVDDSCLDAAAAAAGAFFFSFRLFL